MAYPENMPPITLSSSCGWLIEHDLMSEEFVTESDGIVQKFRAGDAAIYEVYEWWDCCLVNDMLSGGRERLRHVLLRVRKRPVYQGLHQDASARSPDLLCASRIVTH